MLVFENRETGNAISFTVNDETLHETKWYEGVVIVYVLKGAAKVIVRQESYVVGTEEFIVIGSFEPYSVLRDQDTHVIALHISDAALRHSFDQNDGRRFFCCSARCEEYQLEQLEDIRCVFATLFRVTYKQSPVTAAYIYKQVYALVDILSKNFRLEQSGDQKEQGAQITKPFRTILQYISSNYRSDISIGAVAKAHYMTANSLSRYFQKYMRMTFTEFVSTLRLNNAYAELLCGKQRITEIALENGFKSTNAFIKSFKNKHGITPGRFRDVLQEIRQLPQPQTQAQGDENVYFDTLLKHLNVARAQTEERRIVSREVSADIGQPMKPLDHQWKNLLCIGYAKEGLLAHVQRQLRELQQDIGFRYISFHGIFDDDMLVCTRNENGSLRFDFSLVDQLLDFLLEIKLSPYIELSFMPCALVHDTQENRQFRRASNLCLPQDIAQWMQLIHVFTAHIEDRYGASQVKCWRFAVMSIHCAVQGGLHTRQAYEQYCRMYCETYRFLKKANPAYQIGGPGLYANALQEEYFKDFLSFCVQEDCLPDQYTFLCFPYEPISGSNREFFTELSEGSAFPEALSEDENYVRRFHETFLALRNSLALPSREVTLLEWNSTMWQRDFCNDSCFKAAYLVKNITENYDAFWGMGYWTVNDMSEETAPGSRPFHGGYGLHTVQGIEKSAYLALRLLAKSGDQYIRHGDGYFITKTPDSVCILLYNYCHYDLLYRNHCLTNPKADACYDRFLDKDAARFVLSLAGLSAGNHRVKIWAINRAHGSAFDAWLEMGSPAYLNAEELALLRGCSGMRYRVNNLFVEEKAQIITQILPHEVQLITIDL